MTWGAVAAAAATVVGGAMSKRSADKDRKAMKKAGGRLGQVSFDPKNITGPGGMGVFFGEDGTEFELGDFQDIFDLFGDISFDSLLGAQDYQAAAGEFLPGIFEGIGQSLTLSDEAFDRIGDLQEFGFQRDLQDQLFGGAGMFADRLMGGFDGIRDDTFALLERMAAPGVERTRQNLAENLFGQGTIGQKSGQMLTEGVAQGLAQAQDNRALLANQEARNVQQGYQSLLGQFLGGGQALAQQESDLLGQAFGQFGSTLGLAADLQGNVFNQGSALFNQGGQSMGGMQALLGMLMSLGGFSGDLGATAADVDLRAAGGQAGVLGNLGASGNDMMAGFLASLGSNLQDIDFRGMFGGTGNDSGGNAGNGTPNFWGMG